VATDLLLIRTTDIFTSERHAHTIRSNNLSLKYQMLNYTMRLHKNIRIRKFFLTKSKFLWPSSSVQFRMLIIESYSVLIFFFCMAVHRCDTSALEVKGSVRENRKRG